ncbi:MAG: cardiolipin synthase [Glaciecola sp.]|jgi:cardiolipin synthase|uniref:cardiolipin synthase n=1 Tax=Congregibacter sp. TaxID=2744308 RepID=UPI0039E5CC15
MEFNYSPEIIGIVLALIYVMAIASAVDALLQGRTAQGSIAWVVSLLAVPYISVPLYLVFGRNKFDGYIRERAQIEAQAEARLQIPRSELLDFQASDTSAAFYRSLHSLARLPTVRGNAVTLLIDGYATFDSIEAGLRSAKQYILFQFYILRDDALGQRLGAVLAERAQAGLRVYLLYDEVGSRSFGSSQLHRTLQKAGVQLAAFDTRQGWRNRFQINFRNHRKVVVVDGTSAWIGGHNVGIEYLGESKKRGPWRDTHVKVEGPAVIGAKLTFATDWLWARREQLDINWQVERYTPGNCSVLLFPSDPASEFDEAGLMFHQVITQARDRIWIASPYFVPDRGIIAALQLAALRGVDVRVMIPDTADGPVVGLANWSFTRELLPAGVAVYRYEPAFMHQKVLLMDRELAGVGTANFDNRSFRLNFEITALVHDEAFCDEVETMLLTDFSQSRLVTVDELARKPFWFPLATAAARLMSPVL